MVKLYFKMKNTKNNKYKINNTKKNKQKYKTNNTKKYKIKKSKTIKHNYYKIKKIIKGGSICNLLKFENNSSVGLKHIPDKIKKELLETQKEVEKLTYTVETSQINYDKNNDLSNLINILITTNNFDIGTDNTVESNKIDLYDLYGKYGATQIATSGNLNDCLIHSILTCVSEDFRKLKNKIDKDTIASAFRREILPNINGMSESNKQLLKSSSFLDDRIIESINAFYSIQIIAINNNTNFISLYNVTTYSSDIFFIHNSNNIHFTAIKFTNTNSYKVSEVIFNYLKTEHDKKTDDNEKQHAIKNAKDNLMTKLGAIVNGDLNDGNRYTLNYKRYNVEEADLYILQHGFDLPT